ncbi:SEC14-like protein 2 isoform X2 [Stegodyphus dumicola]|uniref:SEC14-like protein 2 isoform X2 n=1 Tax=Stegodyphus dumicola TaxID=202533 RepID=UPI0015AA75E1|nr:SEC14-like protein 2 isoform X2 [Stegodyphus dumicola]
MSGHMEDLSPNQKQALAEFRQNLSDVLLPKHDDRLLLQFLRARRFDLKKSEDMFRKHLEFRKEFDEDYLLNEYKPSEFLVKYLLPPLLGYDKFGCPVRLIYVGPTDIKGLMSCVRRPEIRRCVTWFLDKDKAEMKKRSAETGKYVEQRTFIFDLNGLSIRQIYHRDVYDLVISFLKLYEGNYPENLRVAYVINSGWKEALLEEIDPEILPVVYGGTRTDPDGDPRCRILIPQGGPIPKEYYLKNQQRLNPEDENVHSVVVGRRSKHSVPVKIDVPGSSVCWEIDCKNCDINISLLYSEGSTPETVVSSTRVSSDHGVEKGVYIGERTGNYTLVLDNSYSFLRSKSILYKIFVSTCTANASEPLPLLSND